MRLTVLHISATLKNTWEKPPPNLTAIELPSISIFSSTVLLIPHYPIQQKHREEQEIGPRQQVGEPTCSGNRECLHQVAEVIRVPREAPPAYNVWNMTVNIYRKTSFQERQGALQEMIVAYRSKAEAIRASFGPWSYICSGYTLLGSPKSNKRRLWSALYLSGDLQNGRWRNRTTRRPVRSMLG